MKDQKLLDTLAKAGFKGQSLQTAYGVAKAESGGRPKAFNPDASTGDRSYGLFQINMLGALGPERRRQFGLKRNEDLYDPLTNARIAYRMSGGGKDWTPWSAYKSGAYKQYTGSVPKPTRTTRAEGTTMERSTFGLPKQTGGSGINAQQLAQSILGGKSAVEAVQEQIDFDAIPQLPQFVAETKARQYGGTVQDFGGGDHPNPKIAQALAIAKKQIGKPYVWGATNPKVGFDCSGLIEYAFEQAGIKTPGRLTTGPMSKMGKKVAWKNVQPGDWIVRDSGGSGHVVMYVGNGQVIAAPRTGEVIQYQPLSRFASDKRYVVRRWHGGK